MPAEKTDQTVQKRRLIRVFTGHTGRIVPKVFPNFPVPHKLVSFPCSLQRLMRVYTVCLGLSDPILRFFEFLMGASFVCFSDEKRLYDLTNISLFFFLSIFLPRFHVTLTLQACHFFLHDKGNITL